MIGLRYVTALFCSAMLGLGMAGCHHAVVAVAPPPPPPVPTISVPPPTHHSDALPMVELERSESLTLELARVPLPRLRPRPTTAKQLALLLPPAPTPSIVLGVLTQGGDANNGPLLHETQALLQTQQKRLQLLPAATARAHVSDVNQAKLFLRRAAEALRRLDVDGAHTLATKAKVLLDDTEK